MGTDDDFLMMKVQHIKRSRTGQKRRGQDGVARTAMRLENLGWSCEEGVGSNGKPDLIIMAKNSASTNYFAEVKSIMGFSSYKRDGELYVQAQNVKLENTSWLVLINKYGRDKVILIVEIRAGQRRRLYKWLPADKVKVPIKNSQQLTSGL